jgi:hypothetical protein
MHHVLQIDQWESESILSDRDCNGASPIISDVIVILDSMSMVSRNHDSPDIAHQLPAVLLQVLAYFLDQISVFDVFACKIVPRHMIEATGINMLTVTRFPTIGNLNA